MSEREREREREGREGGEHLRMWSVAPSSRLCRPAPSRRCVCAPQCSRRSSQLQPVCWGACRWARGAVFSANYITECTCSERPAHALAHPYKLYIYRIGRARSRPTRRGTDPGRYPSQTEKTQPRALTRHNERGSPRMANKFGQGW